MIDEDAPIALRDANHKDKNLIVVEPLATKAQADGLISPSLLTNRMRIVYGREFTRGKAGELGELARLGQFLKQPPQSGTAPRQAAQAMLGQRGMDLAALSTGFYNPAIPMAYYGAKGTGMLANRGLQSRNVNQTLIAKLLTQKSPNSVAMQPKAAISAGNISGLLSAQGQ